MAIRISRAIGGIAENWLRMQEALDIWKAETEFKNNSAIALLVAKQRFSF
jgi:plasmid maintenance system antidote protein VapI